VLDKAISVVVKINIVISSFFFSFESAMFLVNYRSYRFSYRIIVREK